MIFIKTKIYVIFIKEIKHIVYSTASGLIENINSQSVFPKQCVKYLILSLSILLNFT